MRVSHTEATKLFEDHTNHGESRVLIPKEDNLEKFNAMKDATYDEFATSSKEGSRSKGSRKSSGRALNLLSQS